MMSIDGSSFADVYSNALRAIMTFPEFETAPRDMKIRENLNVALKFYNPQKNLYKNAVRSSPVSYIAKELAWYLSGDRTSKYIGRHASLWNQITNADNTVNSNYGFLAFYDHVITNYVKQSQFSWAYHSLVKDKDSRQAIMHFNNSSHQHQNVKDFVCTLSCIFHIRNNMLYMTTTMRSQDLILGLPADYAWFSFLHQQMLNLLKITYPDLKIGTYQHILHSLHIYEKHFDLAKQMLDNEFVDDCMPSLEDNFVTPAGVLTENAKNLVSEIILGKPVRKYEDKLYDWIQQHAG